MKILHCCLANFYIDGFGYQENVLPRIHKQLGHDVEIVASTETYINNRDLGYTNASVYLSADGINVTRLEYINVINNLITRKIRLYAGLKDVLDRFQPDLIFIHDLQFLSAYTIAAYARRNGTLVYADTHTDSINSARNFLSRWVLHRLFYRHCARVLDQVVSKYYATLPIRADFLRDNYGIVSEKITMLPFGVDDTIIDYASREKARETVRRQLLVGDADTVFVTGGKVDKRKNIHLLVREFAEAADRGELSRAILVVFGAVSADIEPLMRPFVGHPSIRFIGWLPPHEIHKYLWAADVAVFPGTHSVLWEETVGLGVPAIFRRWQGIDHIDLGGNCILIDSDNIRDMIEVMVEIERNHDLLFRLARVAQTKGPSVFRYSVIAEKSLEP